MSERLKTLGYLGVSLVGDGGVFYAVNTKETIAKLPPEVILANNVTQAIIAAAIIGAMAIVLREKDAEEFMDIPAEEKTPGQTQIS